MFFFVFVLLTMYNNEVKVYNFYICSIMILFSVNFCTIDWSTTWVPKVGDIAHPLWATLEDQGAKTSTEC